MSRQNGRGAARRRLLSLLAALPFFSLSKSAAAAASATSATLAAELADAPRPLHHVADGTFANTNGSAISKPFKDLMKWRMNSPAARELAFPLAPNNAATLRANRSEPTLTWVGHATFLLQLGGVNIITDPHFSERASPFSFAGPKRGTPPGVALAELPPIEQVLITHNHYDHLDEDSVRALARRDNPHFIVPLKLGDTLAAMGAQRISELDWGGQVEADALTITAEPCHHWSARGMFDRNESLWASYVVQHAGFKFIFIGDTGYSQDFAALGEKYNGFDWAAIPIGAYEPRWFMKAAHINPSESVQIFGDLRAKRAVASHWGVFQLTDEPLDEPPRKLQDALAAALVSADDFAVWQHGESRSLAGGERLT